MMIRTAITVARGRTTALTLGLRSFSYQSTVRPQVIQSRIRALALPMHQARRSMFIQTATTPNDDALKFLPSELVLGEGTGTIEFLSGREAISSPLARKLFSIDGVRSVMFGPDFITVEKTSDAQWLVLKPEVFSVITEHLTAGAPVMLDQSMVPPPASDTAPSDEDSEVVSMIKELIDTRVRPAIQEDGGDLEYRGFTDEGMVLIKLRGACRSCDSSTVTLKNGIESMLMHYVEEVNGVEQVLDPEDEVSLQEFEKLEKRLNERREEVVPPTL